MKEFGHRKTIEQAVDLLKISGKDVFATWLRNAFLSEGTAYADKSGQDVYLVGRIENPCTGVGKETFRKALNWNTASNTHYFDPFTESGLDLRGIDFINDVKEYCELLVSFGYGFIIWPEVYLDPEPNMTQPYLSAAERCQYHYNRAIKVWNNLEALSSYGNIHGRMAEAFFELGWACHFIADMCIPTHTMSTVGKITGAADNKISIEEFFIHEEYEKKLDELVGNVNVCNPETGESTGLTIDNNGNEYINEELFIWAKNSTAYQILAQLATEIREKHCEFLRGWTSEDFKSEIWSNLIQNTLPRGYLYTALLLSKFLYEVNISQEIKPLLINIKDDNDLGIPNACLFYRLNDRDITTPWNLLVCDKLGCVNLTLEKGKSYDLRPAMPGYIFEGNYYCNFIEFPIYGSPVRYIHDPMQNNFDKNISLILKKVADEFLINSLRFYKNVLSISILDSKLLYSKSIKVNKQLNSKISNLKVNTIIDNQIQINAMGEFYGFEPYIETGRSGYIVISLRALINSKTGDFIRSKKELEELVQKNLVDRKKNKQLLKQETNRETNISWSVDIQKAYNKIPREQFVDKNGKISSRFYLDNLRKGSEFSTLSLWPSLPVPEGSKIMVECISEQGFIGTGFESIPLEISTNKLGEAWFKVSSQTQEGILRLKITVTSIKGIKEDMWPSPKFIDLVIFPSVTGDIDILPDLPPVIEVADAPPFFHFQPRRFP